MSVAAVADARDGSRPRLPAIDRPSIEELTVLSEAEALRRRIDQRNLPVLRVLAAIFTVYGLVMTLVAAFSLPWLAKVTALASLLLSAGFFVVLMRIDPARPDRKRWRILDGVAHGAARNFRTATLAYLALQYLFLALPSGKASGPWLYLFPLILIVIRLSLAEAAVLHTYFFVVAFVLSATASTAGVPGPGTSSDQILVPSLILNILAWGVGAVAMWRYRKGFLANWRDLRERTREQVRMRDELELARRVQISMLPRGEISDGWIQVAGASVPATEVGGDYFDWFRLDGDRVAVVAGDVAGHGLASGLILSGIKSGLVLLSAELERPAAVLGKLQRLVRETAAHRMLVTLAVLLLDRERGQAIVASAGHPPVLHRHARSGAVEQMPAASLPLGSRLRQTAQEITVPTEPGDLFVLYTDGVYEAEGKQGEPFGFERLSEVVASATPEASPRQICDAILAAVHGWSGQTGARDDATVVAVRVGSGKPDAG